MGWCASPSTGLPGDARGEFIVVEDCERVTRQLQHVLEVEGLAYERLEVSSPGLDRPLKKEADFRRFAGEAVALTLKAAVPGPQALPGPVAGARGGGGRLAPAACRAASRRRRPGVPRPASRRKPAAVPATAVPDAEPVLEFRLDEVREARLVPVVDFKGRRFRPDGPPEAAPASTPTDNEAAKSTRTVDAGGSIAREKSVEPRWCSVPSRPRSPRPPRS